MRPALVLVAALAAGCAAVQDHPFSAIAVVNSTAVVAAGACTADCHNGVARDASEVALVAELAASSTLALWFGAWLVYEATGDER